MLELIGKIAGTSAVAKACDIESCSGSRHDGKGPSGRLEGVSEVSNAKMWP